MTAEIFNIHATAITVDGVGLLFLGHSGSGKSALAFDCLAEARLAHRAGALISDDRVLVCRENGIIVARGPEQIRGLMELRYSGIVSVDHIGESHLHYAVMLFPANEQERLPPDSETVAVVSDIRLPLIRVPNWTRFPLSLIFAQIGSRHGNG